MYPYKRVVEKGGGGGVPLARFTNQIKERITVHG